MGIDCDLIEAEWAASASRVFIRVAVRDAMFPQKNGKVATLIDKFMYRGWASAASANAWPRMSRSSAAKCG